MTADDTTARVRELSTQEVVERYNGRISKRTLDNWRSQGKGPKYVRRGGKIFYPIDLLEEWDRNSVFQSTSNYKAA